jgi:hypothetical protein
VTNFLFWNINRKPISELIAALVQEHKIDVLMLAECEIEPDTLRSALSVAGTPGFQLNVTSTRAVQLFTRFPNSFVGRVADGPRYSIRRLNLPGGVSMLLAMFHLPSLPRIDKESQILEASVVSRSIRDAEAQAGHSRTLVVGDFNMNPFDAGIVGAAGFNAVMHRDTAARMARTVRGDEYPFLYNPMWNHFGDEGESVPGTYYYGHGDHVTYYWHMYDQVLVRPELLSRLPVPAVTILTMAGSVSLLNKNGRPDHEAASDHLPIVFSLNLKESLP